jgi:hypothetical protein
MAESSRKGQKSMGDGSAEGRLCRPFRVDMDELVIIGGVGECVDARLRNLDPLGDSKFRANEALDVGE